MSSHIPSFSKRGSAKKFPKSARLLKSFEFKRLRSQSRRLFGSTLAIQVQKAKTGSTRLGITVSKKFGKAHERNRFKRLVREAFREIYPSLTSDLTINVFPQGSPALLSYHTVLNEFKKLIDKTSFEIYTP